MSDLVSRQYLLDEYDRQHQGPPGGARKIIEEAPDAQPEVLACGEGELSAEPRPKGQWVYNSPVTMKCDLCGFVIKDWDWHKFEFCPNCGADMRQRKEEHDESE